MSQTVGQQNQVKSDDSSGRFATAITDCSVKEVTVKDKSIEDVELSFKSPCLELNNATFQQNKSYYLHVRIKRLSSNQTFYITLTDKNDELNEKIQQIRTIRIAQLTQTEQEQSSYNSVIDYELIFQPWDTGFQRIVFELKRGMEDLDPDEQHEGEWGRVPLIAFLELSEINNVIPVSSIYKLGIQSRPHLITCINGEEIQVPNSGIFEMRDGIIVVNFFSVVCAGKIIDESIQQKLDRQEAGTKESESDFDPTKSISLTDVAKKRTIDSFTLDYLYKG